MNETPQTTRKDEQDLLEQIITQGLDQANAPAQTKEETSWAEAHPAPKQEDGRKTAHTVDRRHRRSAVYLYLVILFGAAFLMLLLAYFVQQRSNENTISDLRDTMNLSRQELLDEIRELEEQNTALEEQNAELQELNELQRTEISEKIDSYDALVTENYAALAAWNSFWELEQYYQAEDYENCAALLILHAQGQYRYRTPDSAQERYDEIIQAVIDADILDGEYKQHPDDYEYLLDAYLTEHSINLPPIGC